MQFCHFPSSSLVLQQTPAPDSEKNQLKTNLAPCFLDAFVIKNRRSSSIWEGKQRGTIFNSPPSSADSGGNEEEDELPLPRFPSLRSPAFPFFDLREWRCFGWCSSYEEEGEDPPWLNPPFGNSTQRPRKNPITIPGSKLAGLSALDSHVSLVLVSFLLALWKPKTHNTTAQLGQEIMTQQNFSLEEKIKAGEKRRRLTPHRQRCEDAQHSRKIASLAETQEERERYIYMVVWWTETYCRRTATYRHCWRTCNVLALQPCELLPIPYIIIILSLMDQKQQRAISKILFLLGDCCTAGFQASSDEE